MKKKRKGYNNIEDQIKANKKWIAKNKEYKNYLNRRSNARGFIRSLATLEDLKELKELIKERKNILKNDKKN